VTTNLDLLDAQEASNTRNGNRHRHDRRPWMIAHRRQGTPESGGEILAIHTRRRAGAAAVDVRHHGRRPVVTPSPAASKPILQIASVSTRGALANNDSGREDDALGRREACRIRLRCNEPRAGRRQRESRRLCPGPAALVQRLRNPRDNRKAATDWVREHFAWEKTLQPLASVIAA
jgi:hypothetical protein